MNEQFTAGASQGTSSSLIERVKMHDPAAWRRFAELYGPIVYGWSLRQRLQPHDAADVVQDPRSSVADFGHG
jgi:hypothetical protein